MFVIMLCVRGFYIVKGYGSHCNKLRCNSNGNFVNYSKLQNEFLDNLKFQGIRYIYIEEYSKRNIFMRLTIEFTKSSKEKCNNIHKRSTKKFNV